MLTEDAKRMGIHKRPGTGPTIAVTASIGEEVALRKEALSMYTKEVLKEAANEAGIEFKTAFSKDELIDHLAGTATNEQYENLVAAAQMIITDPEDQD